MLARRAPSGRTRVREEAADVASSRGNTPRPAEEGVGAAAALDGLAGATERDGMGEAGATPAGWGKELASFGGVPAFSNGGNSRFYKRGTYGFMYQCVEFVNRYCAKVHGVGNMIGTGNAADYGGDSRKRFGFTWVPNVGQEALPEAGDILVFEGGTYGHVAIATGSDESGVRMIQQNTRSATGTIGVSGKEGSWKVKSWGSLRLTGWQHRGPRKAAPAKDAGAAARRGPSEATSASYAVKRGDTLWAIAEAKLGDGGRYKELAKLNNLADPGAIRAGQVLKLPGAEPAAKPAAKPSPKPEAPQATAKPAAKPARWAVKPGDTLWEIAGAALGDGSRYREIAVLNRMADPSALRVGQVLRLPTG
jgi:nucleoid-associated protein YgaU